MANPRNSSQDNSTRLTANSLPTYDAAQPTQLLVQSVELVQSQELVQIMVCAVVSTVSSLRCLFHEDCFKVHHYDIENPNHSYKDFKEAVNHNSVSAGNGRRRSDHRYVPWDILVPGTDPRVDKLLDWLVKFPTWPLPNMTDMMQELGMIDALSHKYLNTLQLGIYDGEVCLSKRVEAYIMAFSYVPDGVQMELQLSTARGFPSPPGKRIESVKQELRFLVHRLANHIGGFPELPRKIELISTFAKFLTIYLAGALVNMQFTYNDSCPPAYQPPGFVKCQDYGLILRDDQGAMVGSINPGPHR
jgi:HORMA domain